MAYLQFTDKAQQDIKLYYEEYGKGKPVLLIHGWPLSGDMWEYQITALTNAGYRLIIYDRRGFGKSSRPATGYDYDTLTEDLNTVIEQLQLTDITLVGFSMGGGEVARYMGKFGGNGVSKVAFISSVTPFLGKAPGNEDGVDQDVFQKMLEGMKKDRPAFLQDFSKDFYGVSLVNHPVSDAFLQHDFILTSLASAVATMECAKAFANTDFRKDVESIKVPALIIHGDADKTVPIDASGKRTAAILKQAKFITYADAPHGLFYTERERLNKDLLSFIKG